jgi:glycosyltransferase involved in cell wall biosynthesis
MTSFSSNKPRVLILLENRPYPWDYRVEHEARSLTQAGYQVTVISPGQANAPSREVVDGVFVFRYPPPRPIGGVIGYLWEYCYSFAASFLLSLLIWRKPGFDIIHATNPPDIMVCIAMFYKLFGKRFIFDHHDLCPELYNARLGGQGNRLIYNALVWFEKLTCRFADHIIATNYSYKKMEMERGHVSAERITVVRNGPDEADFKLCQVDPDPRLRVDGKTVLLYAGAIGFQDGVEHLIQALDHVVHDLHRSDVFAYIVGDGEAIPSLKAMTNDLGLANTISFTGHVEHTDVFRYLQSADICVAPEPSNPYNDRSTIVKIMEYMAGAKPIVAFDLPEHQVSAQSAAVFALPNDDYDFALKIAYLMDNPDQRKLLGMNGRSRVEMELSWAQQEKALLDAYRKTSQLFPAAQTSTPISPIGE